ncbi:MAG: LytTR family DNA-binding domain-containing protein [Bacteroidales bacterium]|jgi:two-component system LytT family response regulator|nr:LytTR family DNA-binding domain-containing protein [Bacteroidales bacterium]
MNKKLKTVIIDDEANAVDFISSIIGEYCPDLEVAGKANDVADGVQKIQDIKPGLIFLDVEMPNGTGFDLLTQFPEKDFDVIFITAFNHYAIKAIKFSAVDYILKPININEFIEAVNKVVQKRANPPINAGENFRILMENLKTATPSRLAIPTSDGMEYLNPKDIIRIEADRSYSWFYLTGNRKILVSKHLKEFQDLLGDRNFFRSHNSFLINLKFVHKYIRKEGGYILMQDGAQIPVSRNRKDLFLIHMSRFKG